MIAILFSLLVCCSADTIPQLAEKLGATTLLQLVDAAGLTDTLSGPGPFTVFAPTNDAFAAVPKDVLNKLMKDKALLKSILTFHVLGFKLDANEITNDMTVTTLSNSTKARLNVYGKTLAIDGSKILMADQEASNGVIHVVDKVLTEIPTKNIVQLVAGNPDFSSLVYAVIRANIISELQGGPFTLFAPTDEAFKKIPSDAINKLLQNETALIDVLTYHVIKGTVYSVGLSSGMVPTVEGESVKIQVESNNVMVNGAKVTTADVPVTNGVVHVIDTVLLPPK